MNFWANFARYGEPGQSTNGIKWEKYLKSIEPNLMILDRKKDLSVKKINISFESLVNELETDDRISENA